LRYVRVLRRARTFVPAAVAALVATMVLAATVPTANPAAQLLNVAAMPTTTQQLAAQPRPSKPRPPLRVMVVGNELGALAAWALATLPGHPFVVDNATRP